MKYVDTANNGDLLMGTVDRSRCKDKRTAISMNVDSMAGKLGPGREDVKSGLSVHTK